MTKSRVKAPQQSRSAETRAKILDAALISFAEMGYESASIRDIAEAAGTTHPMITYHFGGKEKLWHAAVTTMFERVQKLVIEPALASDGTPEDKYKNMIRLYVRYCAEHPEHARITVSETVRGGSRLKWLVTTFVRQNHIVFEGMMQSLADRKIIPNCDAVSFLYAVVGMCQLPFVLAKEAELAYDTDFFDEEMLKQHTNTVFQLLFREDAYPLL